MGGGKGGLQDAIYERAVGGKPLRKWERGVGLDRCIQYTTTVSADDVNNHKKEFSNPFSVMETEANLYFVPASIPRLQKLRSIWTAPKIATSERVQFSEYTQRIRFVFSANQICQISSEHAQSDMKSVIRALPVLDLPRVSILGADQKERGL